MPIPFVIIELDKPRKLRMTLEASFEFEQTTGKMLSELDDEIKTTIQLLWFMLKQEDENLTFDETCRLVEEYAENYTHVTIKVAEAIAGAYRGKNRPNAKTTAKKNPENS